MSCAKFITCFASFALLAACSATEGDFPSLSRRSYEGNGPITAPKSPVMETSSLPVADAAKVDALHMRHRIAQTAFAKALPAVQAQAINAVGSSPGSESWVAAHLQLSRLDKLRSDSVAVMREFDSLISERGKTDTTLVPLLNAAQMVVSEDLTAQNAEITRLSRLIGE
ncbi:hypothetical protein EUU23_12165 [Sphingorhabdus sp. IMCC26285]|jgi:hypothetical protein|uniref:DUF4142 domain-containing protein n=1 Tax=Sphingorhabdus profundilacus TaxID=2509718 RepID=A0A6I4M6Y9_9SPHN|nr:hypothetical protein [Sphingorhabdus profundilacus]MVZ98448.1 hypothetical protein [Sphingorhabdus profundilacus]